MPSVFSSIIFLTSEVAEKVYAIYLLLFVYLIEIVPSALNVVVSMVVESKISYFDETGPSSPFSTMEVTCSSSGVSFGVRGGSLLSSVVEVITSNYTRLSPTITFSDSYLFVLFF